MSDQAMTTATALARLGIEVTLAGGTWGWSMQNDKLVRPRVGSHATAEAAAAAALGWVLEKAWRGVLAEVIPSGAAEDLGTVPDDDRLLDPWLRALAGSAVTIE